MSNWGSKLEKKLNALADSASKESIQTLSNWIGFNRKHAAIIAKTLAKSLTSTSNSPARQWLYWQVVHELLLNGHGDGDESKWDKLMELRNQIGEQTVIPAMEQLGTDNIPPQVEPFVKQWGELNVFGGPTLVSQIKKLLTAEAKKTTSPAEPVPDAVEVKAPLAASSSSSEAAAAAAATTTTPTPAATSEPAEKKEEPLKIPDETSLQRRRSSLLSLSGKDIEYDFESKVRRKSIHLACVCAITCYWVADFVFLPFSSSSLPERSSREGRISPISGTMQGNCHASNCA